MQIRYLRLASLLVAQGAAFNIQIRKGPLNLTSIAHTTTESVETVIEPSETDVSTPTREHKPRPEITATGWDEPHTSLTFGDVAPSSRASEVQPNVGDLLHSFLTATSQIAMPSIHTERSADGWQDNSKGPGAIQTTVVPNPLDEQPGVTLPPVRPSPPTPVVIGPVTLRPTPITSAQIVVVGGETITKAVVGFQFALENSALAIGSSTNINGVVVALNLDAHGSTVLTVGDMVSTLPAAVQEVPVPKPMQISTAIVNGITQYVLGGQTLLPGQAITVGGIPISFTAKDGTTILAIGSSTTTLAVTTEPASTADWGASIAATPGNGVGSSRPATTSAKGGAAIAPQPSQIFLKLAGALTLLLRYT